jgi:tRNA(fMet)-specific endonuclease VapC
VTRFVLDTDHFSLMEWGANSARQNLLRLLSAVSPDEVFTTIVTYEEQTRGWMAYSARARTIAQHVEAYRKLERHLDIYSRVQVLGFDERAGTEFERLQGLRLRVGTMDLKIAAIALANGATVLTRNVKDFGLVPALRVEDWTQ